MSRAGRVRQHAVHAALMAAVTGIALVGAVDTAAAKRAPTQLRGFDVGAWGILPEAESHRDLREAAALGADAVRVVLRWPWLEPNRSGVRDAAAQAQTDRLFKVAAQEGLTVVATVLFTPCWAADSLELLGACSASPPARPADFGRFISYITDRWGGRIGAIEVWNEPNLVLFWRGSPGAYTGLVRAAHEAVRRSDRRRRPAVVAGALSGSDTGYLNRLYGHGIARWSDGISIHPYDLRLDQGFGDPSRSRPGDPGSFASGLPAIRKTMRANGDQDPLWLTEFGFASCPAVPYCVPPLTQGRYLSASLRGAARRRFVAASLIYRLRDHFGSGLLLDLQFGVLNQDWSRKPAAREVSDTFAALRRQRSR